MGLDPSQVTEGAAVYGSDGRRAGRIVRCGARAFEVEWGFFQPRVVPVPYSALDRLDDGRLLLVAPRDVMQRAWTDLEQYGWTSPLAGLPPMATPTDGDRPPEQR